MTEAEQSELDNAFATLNLDRKIRAEWLQNLKVGDAVTVHHNNERGDYFTKRGRVRCIKKLVLNVSVLFDTSLIDLPFRRSDGKRYPLNGWSYWNWRIEPT